MTQLTTYNDHKYDYFLSIELKNDYENQEWVLIENFDN